jgi:hypothetical protein
MRGYPIVTNEARQEAAATIFLGRKIGQNKPGRYKNAREG